jgi:hypothetical protein
VVSQRYLGWPDADVLGAACMEAAAAFQPAPEATVARLCPAWSLAVALHCTGNLHAALLLQQKLAPSFDGCYGSKGASTLVNAVHLVVQHELPTVASAFRQAGYQKAINDL